MWCFSFLWTTKNENNFPLNFCKNKNQDKLWMLQKVLFVLFGAIWKASKTTKKQHSTQVPVCNQLIFPELVGWWYWRVIIITITMLVWHIEYYNHVVNLQANSFTASWEHKNWLVCVNVASQEQQFGHEIHVDTLELCCSLPALPGHCSTTFQFQ